MSTDPAAGTPPNLCSGPRCTRCCAARGSRWAQDCARRWRPASAAPTCPTYACNNDTRARRSAEEVGARAYTSGSSVVIGTGGADKHTLAHELGHVLQQRQGPVGGTVDHRGLANSSPTDHLEVAAERKAREVMSGPVPVLRRLLDGEPETASTGAHHTPAVQRAPLNILHQGPAATARHPPSWRR